MPPSGTAFDAIENGRLIFLKEGTEKSWTDITAQLMQEFSTRSKGSFQVHYCRTLQHDGDKRRDALKTLTTEQLKQLKPTKKSTRKRKRNGAGAVNNSVGLDDHDDPDESDAAHDDEKGPTTRSKAALKVEDEPTRSQRNRSFISSLSTTEVQVKEEPARRSKRLKGDEPSSAIEVADDNIIVDAGEVAPPSPEKKSKIVTLKANWPPVPKPAAPNNTIDLTAQRAASEIVDVDATVTTPPPPRRLRKSEEAYQARVAKLPAHMRGKGRHTITSRRALKNYPAPLPKPKVKRQKFFKRKWATIEGPAFHETDWQYYTIPKMLFRETPNHVIQQASSRIGSGSIRIVKKTHPMFREVPAEQWKSDGTAGKTKGAGKEKDQDQGKSKDSGDGSAKESDRRKGKGSDKVNTETVGQGESNEGRLTRSKGKGKAKAIASASAIDGAQGGSDDVADDNDEEFQMSGALNGGLVVGGADDDVPIITVTAASDNEYETAAEE